MNLRELKALARKSATLHGHTMTRFKQFGRSHEAHCMVCGQRVHVILLPRPNEIQIGGEAVALNCQREDTRGPGWSHE